MVHFESIGVRRTYSRCPSFNRYSLPLLAMTAVGGVACHSSTAPATAATSGTIITTLAEPPGTKAMATVAGPSDYATFVFSGADTLTLLSAGTYTMSDATATAADPIVTPFYAGTITGSPVTVAEADTAHMGATFTVLPGSGRVWIGSTNGGSAISAGYNSTELTTAAAAGTKLSVAGAYQVLDVNSNLWVADSGATTLSEYVAASLAASGSPSASVSITSSALGGPVGMVFDRVGDLWISNSTSNTIVEFSAGQLAASGAVTPVVTLSGSAISNPGRIGFDVYGNLWVPNTASNTVVEFSVSQLGTSGSPIPAVTLTSTNSSIAGPRAVAFDQQGNLWVANSMGNTFVAFSNSQQTASGSPTPAEILTIPAAVGSPAGFAFDNSGNLWAFGSATSSLIEYSAAQISSGAASQPSLMVSVASKPVSFVLDPPPNGLPLVGPQTGRRKPAAMPAGERG